MEPGGEYSVSSSGSVFASKALAMEFWKHATSNGIAQMNQLTSAIKRSNTAHLKVQQKCTQLLQYTKLIRAPHGV